jgi:hypothetical protein
LTDLRTRKFEPRKRPDETDASIQSSNAAEDYVLAKVLVGMKNLVKEVLSSSNDTVVGGNSHVRDIEKLPSIDTLARMIFNIDSSNTPDDFGLGDLGLGEEEMTMISSLLGQTGAGGSGAMPPDLQQLLGGAMGDALRQPPATLSSGAGVGAPQRQ